MAKNNTIGFLEKPDKNNKNNTNTKPQPKEAIGKILLNPDINKYINDFTLKYINYLRTIDNDISKIFIKNGNISKFQIASSLWDFINSIDGKYSLKEIIRKINNAIANNNWYIYSGDNPKHPDMYEIAEHIAVHIGAHIALHRFELWAHSAHLIRLAPIIGELIIPILIITIPVIFFELGHHSYDEGIEIIRDQKPLDKQIGVHLQYLHKLESAALGLLSINAPAELESKYNYVAGEAAMAMRFLEYAIPIIKENTRLALNDSKMSVIEQSEEKRLHVDDEYKIAIINFQAVLRALKRARKHLQEVRKNNGILDYYEESEAYWGEDFVAISGGQLWSKYKIPSGGIVAYENTTAYKREQGGKILGNYWSNFYNPNRTEADKRIDIFFGFQRRPEPEISDNDLMEALKEENRTNMLIRANLSMLIEVVAKTTPLGVFKDDSESQSQDVIMPSINDSLETKSTTLDLSGLPKDITKKELLEVIKEGIKINQDSKTTLGKLLKVVNQITSKVVLGN